MRVRVEVVGRTLYLPPSYPVGERLFLDTNDPRHKQVLESGWVRRLDPVAPAKVQTAALNAAPAHKMVSETDTATKSTQSAPQPVKGKPGPKPKQPSLQTK